MKKPSLKDYYQKYGMIILAMIAVFFIFYWSSGLPVDKDIKIHFFTAFIILEITGLMFITYITYDYIIRKIIENAKISKTNSTPEKRKIAMINLITLIISMIIGYLIAKIYFPDSIMLVVAISFFVGMSVANISEKLIIKKIIKKK